MPPLFHGTAALGFDWRSRPRRPTRVPENSQGHSSSLTWAHMEKQEPQREEGLSSDVHALLCLTGAQPGPRAATPSPPPASTP